MHLPARQMIASSILSFLLCFGACTIIAPFEDHGYDADVDADADVDSDVDGDTDVDVDGDADVDADGESCSAECEGRVCGPDGCGGICGSGCEETMRCTSEGQCVPFGGGGRWIEVQAGDFDMGARDEMCQDHPEREISHHVTLTRDFQMLSTEVTQHDFESVMSYQPPAYPGHLQCVGDCPVVNITWHEAAAFCNGLSEVEGLELCYRCSGSMAAAACSFAAFDSPYDCPGYRLPTEAEWEYAARAGTTSATWGGDLDEDSCGCPDHDALLNEIAWYCANSSPSESSEERQLRPVRRLGVNPWGLYDMLGNAWEWCHDWYVEDISAWIVDPPGPPTSGSGVRVMRGGCWQSEARRVRAANRGSASPSGTNGGLTGFRPVRTL